MIMMFGEPSNSPRRPSIAARWRASLAVADPAEAGPGVGATMISPAEGWTHENMQAAITAACQALHNLAQRRPNQVSVSIAFLARKPVRND